MKLRLLSALALACFAALPGCVGAEGAVGEDQQSIVRGDVDEGDLQVMALVVTRWDGETVYCSSVLYAPRTLATAAHCLRRAKRVLAYWGNDLLGDFSQLEGPDQPNWRRGTDWRVHPRYDRRTRDADIAVVHLDTDVPVKPLALHEARVPRSSIGAAVQIVGYGAAAVDSDTGTEPKGHFVKRTGFSTYEGSPSWGHPASRHRDWKHRQYRQRRHLMELDGSAPNAGACLGDDGGPALMKIDGEIKVVGINTWQSSFCDSYSYYVRVSDYMWFLSSNALPSK